jgi:hypothetical protein
MTHESWRNGAKKRRPLQFHIIIYVTFNMTPESRNNAVIEGTPPTASLLLACGWFTRQRLGKHVPAAKYTHVTIEKLLDVSLSLRSMSYQRIIGD